MEKDQVWVLFSIEMHDSMKVSGSMITETEEASRGIAMAIDTRANLKTTNLTEKVYIPG